MKPFSVLLSVYVHEEANRLDRCLRSIWFEQTVRPDEIVLVEDGPLTPQLYETIANWESRIGNVFKRVRLHENVGLGNALNIGLAHCTYRRVARMDTDDIAYAYRFERQLEIMTKKNIDICSGWISEFDDDETIVVAYRKVPKTHEEIVRFAKKRNPLNHPAVMYDKEAVMAAGGYKDVPFFEDYHLWVRMLMNGAKFYNLQEPLVHMHAGASQLKRRRGLFYARCEWRFQSDIRKIGFIDTKLFWINVAMRIPPRLVPSVLTRRIYELLRR
jgi:glycosyltransferase involved in cell wall biosynthesis